VLLGHSSTLSLEIERFCGDHDFVPKLGHRCSQVSTVKALVALVQHLDSAANRRSTRGSQLSGLSGTERSRPHS